MCTLNVNVDNCQTIRHYNTAPRHSAIHKYVVKVSITKVAIGTRRQTSISNGTEVERYNVGNF